MEEEKGIELRKEKEKRRKEKKEIEESNKNI